MKEREENIEKKKEREREIKRKLCYQAMDKE